MGLWIFVTTFPSCQMQIGVPYIFAVFRARRATAGMVRFDGVKESGVSGLGFSFFMDVARLAAVCLQNRAPPMISITSIIFGYTGATEGPRWQAGKVAVLLLTQFFDPRVNALPQGADARAFAIVVRSRVQFSEILDSPRIRAPLPCSSLHLPNSEVIIGPPALHLETPSCGVHPSVNHLVAGLERIVKLDFRFLLGPLPRRSWTV
jgi:hypothetical protein